MSNIFKELKKLQIILKIVSAYLWYNIENVNLNIGWKFQVSKVLTVLFSYDIL